MNLTTPADATAPIVFLHIPKTAGQTIHNALVQVVGETQVSPIRVHTQVPGDAPQMPPGYSLYSGHLDWSELETLPESRFVFSVLRDPCERIASFYFFLMKEAQALSEEDLDLPQHAGKKRLLRCSAEDYFFGGNPGFQRFIHDHYDNFYCSYFATRKMRGYQQMQALSSAEKVAAAQKNLPLFDRIYSTLDLGALERDIADRYGAEISVTETYVNQGMIEPDEARWPKLLDRLGSDAAARRLEDFVTADTDLIEALGLKV